MGAGMSDPSNELQALRDEVASLRSRVERRGRAFGADALWRAGARRQHGHHLDRFGATASVASSPTTTFGAGFLEGTFTDAGGTIVILASASAYCSSAGRIIMNVKVDGVTIGAMRVTCNTTLAHMAFPSAHLRLNRLLLPNATFNPPVTRTVRLEPINCTSGCAAGIVTTLADVNDFGEVTVLRLPTP
jgi:hypothetical protein